MTMEAIEAFRIPRCGPGTPPARDQFQIEAARFLPKPRMARLLQKRVCGALPANRAGRPVAAEERYVVSERQQLVLDRSDQGLVIAARNVAAPDGTLEQHIAHDGKPLLRIEQDHASGML